MVAPVPVAGAHGTDPAIRTVLDVVEPAIPGVEIQVQASVSAEVVAENTTATELAVLAETGEPFLRIGPEGVLANLASPSWYLSNSPFGDAEVPESASPDAPPRWGRVSREPAWGWFDHRLHPEPRGVPTSLPADGDPLRLARWSIPFRYGDETVVARGRIVYAPAPGAVTARLQGPERPFEGVAVQLAPGRIPGLYVTNRGTTPVVVLGADDEPFLRIGPDGVEANRHSPTWIDNARARDQDLTAAAAEADPDAAPDWTLVSSSPSTSWLEFRGNYARGAPARGRRRGGDDGAAALVGPDRAGRAARRGAGRDDLAGRGRRGRGVGRIVPDGDRRGRRGGGRARADRGRQVAAGPSSVTTGNPDAAHASRPPSKFTAWKPMSRNWIVASAPRSPVRDIATRRRFIGSVKRCCSRSARGMCCAFGACPELNSNSSRTSMIMSSASSAPAAICGTRWPR